MSEPTQPYEIRFQPAARRAIAERLPETVAAAVLEFCAASNGERGVAAIWGG